MNLKNCLLMALLGLLLSNCYNDEKVWDALDEQEQRIEALESWQKLVNENINALQALVAENDYITSVTPITMDGGTVGYTISFKNQPSVSIYNGEKGEQGDKGDKGDKGDTGSVPTISLVQMEDGNWYWTLNGELMKDSEGNAIRANGKDGADGEPGEDGKPGEDGTPGEDGKPGTSAPAPLLKNGSTLPDGIIEDVEGNPIVPDAVYLSVDGGKEWTRVSGKDGEPGTSAGITEVKESDDGMYVEFVLSDGGKLLVPTKEWADKWEEQIETLNTNVGTLQTLTEGKKFITEVEEITDGYTIHFSDKTSATIKNGVNGADGDDGNTPTVEIKNGNWWINGEDTQIKATGENGKTPEFQIEGGYLQYKFEGDDAWTSLDNVKGSQGEQGPQGIQGPQGDAIFKKDGVKIEGDHVIFTLADGKDTPVKLPLYSSALRFDGYETANVYVTGTELTVTLPDNLTADNYKCLIATITPTSGDYVSTRAVNGWSVSITPPAFGYKSATVTVKGDATSLKAGDQALLSVILTYENGTQIMASRLVKFIPPIGDKNPEDAEVGDFYMSDGSLVGKDWELTDIQKGGCIGIVFSTDVNRIGRAATEALGKKGVTPHGLVMALTNASNRCQWGYGKDENADGADGAPFKDNTGSLSKQYNNVDGYAETHWIIDTYSSDVDNFQNTYSAFYHASLYGTADGNTAKYAAPTNTTGWFIPSMGQWWDILSNLGGINLEGYRESEDTYAYISDAATTAVEKMNDYLNKISGADTFSTSTYFWSSSEYGSSLACNVGFGMYGYLYLDYGNKANTGSRVRCVLAF